MIIGRRSFLIELTAGLVAAPAIVRASSLMPVRTPPIVLAGRGVPRCEFCFGPWGMCAHTGGPLDPLGEGRLDGRVLLARAADRMF
jgi:hypothetical protein